MRTIILLCFVSAAVFAQDSRAATKFGFAYWPVVTNPSFQEGAGVLQNANWTTENKNIVRCDLNFMRSCSTEVIRFFIRPETCGWTIDTTNHTHSFDTTKLSEVAFNLTDNSTDGLLRMCSARDVDVVVCFANWYYGQTNPDTGNHYWVDAGYSWSGFLNDTYTWMNAIASAINNSAYASTVKYIDYQNEWSAGYQTYSTWYIQGVYDNTTANVPAVKRACGLLLPETHADDLKTALGSRTLAAIDFHQYPGSAYTVQQRYDAVHAANAFPGIPVYIGEFAADGANSSQEGAQQSWEVDTTNDAFNAGIYAILHWRLWGPYRPDDPKAWGYDENSPKDVVGGICSGALLDLANPDMETSLSGTWTCAGASGTNPSLAQIPDANHSATNTHFARVTNTTGSGSIWMTSSMTTLSVTGVRRMSANCFFRSKNLNNVHMVVKEYSAAGTLLATHTGLGYNPPDTYGGGMWFNYSRIPGDTNWFWALNGSTAKITVTINGTIKTTGITSYLEVDTVSVW